MSSRRISRNRIGRNTIENLEPRQLLSVSLISQSTAGVAADTPGAGSVGSTAMSPSISDDGRYVAFASEASNLVQSDNNGAADIFVRDRTTNTTILVSADPDGSAGNGKSGDPGGFRNGYAMSGNGRFVVFASEATNLVSGQTDNNNLPDYFVRDLQTNTTTLVTATTSGGYSTSSNSGGTNGRPAISDDGRFIAFTATYADLDANTTDADGNAGDVFVRDTQTNTTKQLTKTANGQPGGGSIGASPSISSDGRFVAFTSNDKLLPGVPDLTFLFSQVWIYDTTSNTVIAASVAPDGTTYGDSDSSLPRISADGHSVAFQSGASNLVSGFTDNNAGSADDMDVFVRNLTTNTTLLASHDAGSPTSGANDATGAPSISDDGRYVAYESRAKNLVSGITDNNDQNGQVGGEDVFQFDATTGQNKMLSVNTSGTSAGTNPAIDIDADDEAGPAMSGDGRYVAFVSTSDDLVAGDSNLLPDLFVRDTQANSTRRVFAGETVPAGAIATSPSFAADGSVLAFIGTGIGLAGGSTFSQQVFADTQTGGGGGGNNDLSTLVPTLFAELPTAALSGAKAKGAAASVNITNTADTTYSGPVTVTIYLSSDQSLDTGSDPQLATVTKKLKIDSAQTKTVKVKIRAFPDVPEGDYVTIAQVSGTNVPAGTNTDDTSVHLAPPFVDLSGVFASGPATITKGKKSTILLTVTNNGNVPAKKVVPVSIATATDAGGAGATTFATANAKISLKPGASRTIKLNFLTPAETGSGSFFIAATLDATNVLAEKDETNNLVVSPSQVTIS
jgi:hypothetical protein